MEIVEPALMPYFVDYGDLVVVGCRDEHSSVHVHQVLHAIAVYWFTMCQITDEMRIIVKTGPSFVDTALGRIIQGTEVVAEDDCVGQVLFVTKIQRQRAEWTSQLRILLEAPDQGSYLVILADARPLFSGIRVLIWHN
ncbi:hypothetical protein MUK42_32721 [Musa troglodytarum]|uniref:Uncharacterized protein n=1 Tax=Musa troglodytarum TaxID=320322 RepID=A0A9E7FW33_9LILI|nr:hypothetical protein MUK42_32721 [Musa troglodytarum]